MSDVVIATNNENPDIAVEDEGFALVVGDGDAHVEDKSAELEVENAKLRAQIEAANASPAPDAGFAALAEEIRKIQPPAPEPQAPAGTDYNSFLKEKGADFYKDPAMTSAAISAQISQDTIAPVQAVVDTQALQISKLTVLNTPGDKELFIKYKDETEALAVSMTDKSTAYQEALNQVRVRHQAEIIDEAVNARLAEAVTQAETAVGKPSAPLPVDVSAMPRKPAKVNYQIPTKDWQAIGQWCLIKGYDLGTPEAPGVDQEWVLRHMRTKGVIK